MKCGVYILRGTRYYVGSTSDLKRRLEEHKRGHTHTTKRIGSPAKRLAHEEWKGQRELPFFG